MDTVAGNLRTRVPEGMRYMDAGQPSLRLRSTAAALVGPRDGKEAAQYDYGPFGEVLRMTGPMAEVNPFRFSTKYQDDETDPVYYGYRHYNAKPIMV